MCNSDPSVMQYNISIWFTPFYTQEINSFRGIPKFIRVSLKIGIMEYFKILTTKIIWRGHYIIFR